ncbi:MAG TPA: glucoamylase family protein [Chitinophagaceae bacterium]|nr:glucoamylase family protein [Chitinophagaceae bacterium]
MSIQTDKDLPVLNEQGNDKEMLDNLQRESFRYFLAEVDPVTGLVADKTCPGSPSSIAVVGMSLSVYIIGIKKGYLSYTGAIAGTLKILRFFYNSRQGTEPDATGYKGFYYHFLDMKTGQRAGHCELSTIDTAIFMAGVLSVATFFSGNDKMEAEVRQLADALYRRVNWRWALNGGITITHGWNPESGFLPYRWDDNYSEAHILYTLALGSPTYPISPDGYKKWTATFDLKTVYETEYLYAGPLFIHQFSHMWIDFRNILDDFNREAGFDYFENSKRATYVHRKYAIENPHGFKRYGPYCWGLTASFGPGNEVIEIDGRPTRFYGYIARGAPFGPDDGTIAPWAVVASLPFAPEIVLITIRHAIEKLDLKPRNLYGFDASFNATYPETTANPNGWISPWRFGLNQAPVIIMIENYQSGLLWNIMRQCGYFVSGLQKAGFSGGWLTTTGKP